MASVARQFQQVKIYLVFTLISQLIAGSHLPPVNPRLVDISDHWQKKGFIHQDKHVKEVIVKQGLDHLHLVCDIDPALPLTEEHFSLRNELVKFEKLYPEQYVVPGTRYWSDNQMKTAVALDAGSHSLFGPYTCTYGSLKHTVKILAENADVLKDLPAPKTLEEMFSFAFIKKNHAEDDAWKNARMQPVVGSEIFHCKEEGSKIEATSVHKLTPSDIDVVASLGDSIMVGLGATAVSLPHFFTEFRGISWSNGGELSVEDVVTLPNILKRFNPHLKGYSTSNGRRYNQTSGFNMAMVSSTSRDLQEQVEDLIGKIKQDRDINFEDDWKLVTVMTGSRDLCRMCENKIVVSPDDYIKSLMKAIDTLQAKLPRTFVNLVLPLNVSMLDMFYRDGDCLLQNWSICPCVKNEFMRKKISNFLQGYKRLVYELVESGVYDRTEDFTVVIQPSFDNLSFGAQDRDLFTLDCLHFSAKGNALAAISLWNNMVEPVNKKHSRLSEKLIKCPSKDSPYLFTHKNSDTASESSFNSRHQDGGMKAGVVVAIFVSTFCALSFIFAFIFLKNKLNTPLTKLSFRNRPWLKYSI